MLLLDILQAQYPTVPSGGTWVLTQVPNGLYSFKVNGTCVNNYPLNTSFGDDNPLIEFTCIPMNNGLYTFQYSYEECGILVSRDLVVNSVDALEVGIQQTGSALPCEYTATIVHPDDDSARVKLIPKPNNVYGDISYRGRLDAGCTGTSTYESFLITGAATASPSDPSDNYWSYLDEHAFIVYQRRSFAFAVNSDLGYISEIKLHDNLGNSIIANVSPLTSPYLNGVYIVDPNNLYFGAIPVGNGITSIYTTSLKQVLVNVAASVFGNQFGNAYTHIYTNKLVAGGVGSFTLSFACKHNAQGHWIAPNVTDYRVKYVDSLGNHTVLAPPPLQIAVLNTELTYTPITMCGLSPSQTVVLSATPTACSGADIIVMGIANGVNGATVNYNNIVLGTAEDWLTSVCDYENVTCPSTITLTLLATPTCPNATYLWSTGATTQSIIINDPGTYTVTITCDSCEYTASITI